MSLGLGVDDGTNVGAVAQIVDGREPFHELEPGKVYAILDGDGGFRVVDTDGYSDAPRFAANKGVVNTVEAFVAYLEKHGTAATEVWADLDGSTITAVIDANGGVDGKPGHAKHRITLRLTHSEAWKVWDKFNEKWLEQADFAELVEKRIIDFVDPTGARMLEVAQSMEATKGVEFKSGVRNDNGEVKFTYTEQIDGKAGPNGDIEIPREFKLGIKPYLGGVTFAINARFRYRIGAGKLAVGYVLDRPEDVLSEVFEKIVALLREGREADESKKVTALTPLTQTIYFGSTAQ